MVRPLPDQEVDRPQAQGGRPPQPSGTNRPSPSRLRGPITSPARQRAAGRTPFCRTEASRHAALGAPGDGRGPRGAGGNGGGGIPGPMPNPEVKPSIAGRYCGAVRGRRGRRRPPGGHETWRRGPRGADPPRPPPFLCLHSGICTSMRTLLSGF